jgi:hypothetical protein
MSQEQTAYVDRASVPQLNALQDAVDSLGFDYKLDGSYMPFTSAGFLACLLNGRKSGFEIYFDQAGELLRNFPDLAKAVGKRDIAITFRWGGDMAECASVMIVSAALAKSFDAIVHYQNDDIVYSAEQLVEQARAALTWLQKKKR